MKKRTIRLLMLFVCMMLGGQAFAQDFSVDGFRYGTESTQEAYLMPPVEGSYSGDVTIPACVTYEGTTYRVVGIGADAFRGAKSLTSVTLPPGSIRFIGEYAFNDCSLTSITIPASVREIGQNAFLFCDKLKDFYISWESPDIIDIADNAFNYINYKGNECVLHVPTGAEMTYTTNLKFMSVFTSVSEWKVPQLYGISVVGVQVTEENYDDVLGDGKVAYAPAQRTLTFTDCDLIAGENQSCIVSDLTEYLTITGTATLQAVSGMVAMTKAGVTFENATVNFSSNGFGFVSNGGGQLFFDNSSVKGTSGATRTIVTGFDGLATKDCFYVLPIYAGAWTYTAASGWVYDNGDLVTAFEIKAGTPNKFNLWVGGTQVTEANRTDILGDGAASYDPEEKTLTLRKDISGWSMPAIVSDDKLDIFVENDVTITSNQPSAIVLNEKSTIKGDYYKNYIQLTIDANGNTGISMQEHLSVKNLMVALNNCATGIEGVKSAGIDIYHSVLSCKTTAGGSPVTGFRSLVLNYCYYNLPDGPRYDDGRLYDITGNIADEIHILRGSAKDAPNLSFPRDIYIAALGESFTSPQVINPDGFAVTYKSSDPYVATVDENTGEVTIHHKGTTNISAVCAGDATHYSANVPYTLVVGRSSYLRYDVNGDGKVTITDAVGVVDAILEGSH